MYNDMYNGEPLEVSDSATTAQRPPQIRRATFGSESGASTSSTAQGSSDELVDQISASTAYEEREPTEALIGGPVQIFQLDQRMLDARRFRAPELDGEFVSVFGGSSMVSVTTEDSIRTAYYPPIPLDREGEFAGIGAFATFENQEESFEHENNIHVDDETLSSRIEVATA